MENSERLFLYIISVLTVFLPLTWTWVRSALWVMEKINKDDLHHIVLWKRLFYIFPVVALGTFAGTIGASITCLSKCEGYSLGSIFGIVFLFVAFATIGFTLFVISWGIYAEFETILNRKGM